MTVSAGGGLYGYNIVHEVEYRGGLIGLFAGESQAKALTKTVTELNRQGRVVTALVVDRWSFRKRLLWSLVLLVTFGFSTRSRTSWWSALRSRRLPSRLLLRQARHSQSRIRRSP